MSAVKGSGGLMLSVKSFSQNCVRKTNNMLSATFMLICTQTRTITQCAMTNVIDVLNRVSSTDGVSPRTVKFTSHVKNVNQKIELQAKELVNSNWCAPLTHLRLSHFQVFAKQRASLLGH